MGDFAWPPGVPLLHFCARIGAIEICDTFMWRIAQTARRDLSKHVSRTSWNDTIVRPERRFRGRSSSLSWHASQTLACRCIPPLNFGHRTAPVRNFMDLVGQPIDQDPPGAHPPGIRGRAAACAVHPNRFLLRKYCDGNKREPSRACVAHFWRSSRVPRNTHGSCPRSAPSAIVDWCDPYRPTETWAVSVAHSQRPRSADQSHHRTAEFHPLRGESL